MLCFVLCAPRIELSYYLQSDDNDPSGEEEFSGGSGLDPQVCVCVYLFIQRTVTLDTGYNLFVFSVYSRTNTRVPGMNPAFDLFISCFFILWVSECENLWPALLVHSGQPDLLTTLHGEENLRSRILRRLGRQNCYWGHIICLCYLSQLFICVCASCLRRSPEKTVSYSRSCTTLRELSVRPGWTWKRPHR